MNRLRSLLILSTVVLVSGACADLPRNAAQPAPRSREATSPKPSAAQPVPGLWVQVGHSTPWTWPEGSTKMGAVAPPGAAPNDAYIGLRLKQADARGPSNFARDIQGGGVGGLAATWTSDIIVRLVVQKDAGGGRFARPQEDFEFYLDSPARDADAAPLAPVAGSGGYEYDVRIPARSPGTVVWVAFRSVGDAPRKEVRATLTSAREESGGRPVAIGWNDVARFVIEPYSPALRVEPRNETGRVVVHFASVASVPHRPLIATEVVSEGGFGLGPNGSNEHRWNLSLRQDDVETQPGNGQIGGKGVTLSEPLTVVYAVDEKLTTATYGEDYVFVDGYGGAKLTPLPGMLAWKVALPAGQKIAHVYARFLPDRETEGWEQLVIKIVRTSPARVGIGWNARVRWLIQDTEGRP